MARITRLNAEANFGAMLAVVEAQRRSRALRRRRSWRCSATAIAKKTTTGSTSSTARSTPTAPSPSSPRRASQPVTQLDLRVAYKQRLHRLEGRAAAQLLGLEAQRRCAGGEPQGVAGVVGVGVCGIREIQVGTDASPPASWSAFPTLGPIEKPGYYMGAQLDAPVSSRVRVGGSITREELTRDDSLIQYLDLNNLYGVTMGKKDRDADRARLHRRQPPRERQLFLDGRLESVPVGERQLAGVRARRPSPAASPTASASPSPSALLRH